jgi:hypothetical protein
VWSENDFYIDPAWYDRPSKVETPHGSQTVRESQMRMRERYLTVGQSKSTTSGISCPVFLPVAALTLSFELPRAHQGQ